VIPPSKPESQPLTSLASIGLQVKGDLVTSPALDLPKAIPKLEFANIAQRDRLNLMLGSGFGLGSKDLTTATMSAATAIQPDAENFLETAQLGVVGLKDSPSVVLAMETARGFPPASRLAIERSNLASFLSGSTKADDHTPKNTAIPPNLPQPDRV
jgi:hypothetical protein